MEETNDVVIEELVTLSKYEGDAVPENEIERITILNGTIISHETIENGKVVSTNPVREVE